jgi:hypothetical protein
MLTGEADACSSLFERLSEVTAKSYLSPEDPFPAELKDLPDTRLHILNSLVHRQVEREYLDSGGLNPETEFRLDELRVELDRRASAADQALHIPAPPRHAVQLPA